MDPSSLLMATARSDKAIIDHWKKRRLNETFEEYLERQEWAPDPVIAAWEHEDKRKANCHTTLLLLLLQWN
jgi:hypothetical protein